MNSNSNSIQTIVPPQQKLPPLSTPDSTGDNGFDHFITDPEDSVGSDGSDDSDSDDSDDSDESSAGDGSYGDGNLPFFGWSV